ncbi:hypothetical protein PFICI_11239 [Pestalotiopsis fici W106-1]|uniref:Sodium/calcium exchanger membrane region domain-containing protein n=1 Tax=Pestalotiopsis fici (strain W106-1 / CGMCC3.15140) TaxID=1229662 RepID=W3WU36_PESFW|nr:uncharacterized protein PFICI_11239 [Pestalotiopsis fici W106-1]ETS77365.1 hypothetical protein PFICI_11239 [Pestalotiopsis fici W106-1]
MLNLLLIPGFCCFIGGMVNLRDVYGNGYEQALSTQGLEACYPQLMLATAVLLVHEFSFHSGDTARDDSVRVLSLIAAAALLTTFVFYLWVQLKTHDSVFNNYSTQPPEEDSVIAYQNSEEDEEDEEDATLLSPVAAWIVFLMMTATFAFCAQRMMSAIYNSPSGHYVNRNLLGFIVIPFIRYFTLGFTAVVVAIKDKTHLAIGLALGATIDMSSFETPILIILSQQLSHKPLTLDFPACM